MTDDKESTHPPAVRDAIEAFWEIMRLRLEAQGTPEAAIYLEYHLKAVPVGEEVAGSRRRHQLELYQRISDYTSRYNANTGERIAWHFDALREDASRDLPESETLASAARAAEPPPDAILDVAEYEEHGGEPVFIARWRHEREGIPIERDAIHTLVNGSTGKVFSFYKRWHEVNETPSER